MTADPNSEKPEKSKHESSPFIEPFFPVDSDGNEIIRESSIPDFKFIPPPPPPPPTEDSSNSDE